MIKSQQDSYLDITLKELDKEDPDYKLLKKLSDHMHVSLANKGAEGIGIFRESFTDVYVGGYYVSESGSGLFQGLRKIVEGVPQEIRPTLVGEIVILRGNGVTELVPPKGWKIINDSDIQSKYNVGTSPNWKVAAIEYIGV